MNCPDCDEEMKAVTSRTPEKAWRCENPDCWNRDEHLTDTQKLGGKDDV